MCERKSPLVKVAIFHFFVLFRTKFATNGKCCCAIKKFGLPLQSKNEKQAEMSVLSLIGAGAAWLNYRRAKKNYDAAKEKYDALKAAIQNYSSNRLNGYIDTIDTNAVDLMPGVQMTTILRVGNLVGQLFRVQASVVLSNTSQNTYYIDNVMADCFVYDKPIAVYAIDTDAIFTFDTANVTHGVAQQIRAAKWLKPGETLEIKLPAGISGLPDNERAKLKEAICAACGKSLITSCPATSLNDVEKADVQVSWTEETGHDLKTARTIGLKGSLRYMGEAFYPKD